ncbi:MAG: tetratricopeptide repeat protein [Kiritimatiellia bacterium]|nr:tetratricopeptide repeat protein [Kiritimatiellia bacterium]
MIQASKVLFSQCRLLWLLPLIPFSCLWAEPATPEATPVPAEQSAPEDPVLVSFIREGYAELRGGNPDGAERAFRAALQINPNHRDARFGLGTVLITAEKHGPARDILLKMAEDFPNDYFVLNNLGWLFATSRDVTVRDGDRAIHFARAALVLAPEDFHVWSTLSEAYFIAGQYERAARSSQEALRLARLSGLGEAELQNYRRLAEKCQAAVSAMSILEL